MTRATDTPGPVEIARAHWGPAVPDWILALAEECAQRSQARVAAEIGRSATVVSQLLRAKYPGDLAACADLIRGHYMAGTVDCPARSHMPAHECRAWMARARDPANTNAQRVLMFRACRACPRFLGEGEA